MLVKILMRPEIYPKDKPSSRYFGRPIKETSPIRGPRIFPSEHTRVDSGRERNGTLLFSWMSLHNVAVARVKALVTKPAMLLNRIQVMKTFETVQEILENTQAFHSYATNFYRNLNNDCKNERVKMLLKYMYTQEEKTAREIGAFIQHSSKSVLGTWVQITLEVSTEKFFGGFAINTEIGVNELNEIGQQVDAYLVDVFEDLSTVAATDQLRDIFQNLMDMETSRKRGLSKAVNSLLLDM